MNRSRPALIAAAIAVSAAAATPTALAGGEPKNVPPFSSATTARSTAASVIPGGMIATARAAIVGEPKTMLPFSRRIATDALGRFLQARGVAA